MGSSVQDRVLDRLGAKTRAIFRLSPDGVTLLDLAAYISAAGSAMAAIEAKGNPLPPDLQAFYLHGQSFVADLVRVIIDEESRVN